MSIALCSHKYRRIISPSLDSALHRELERFVAAGFTPMGPLQTATIKPAKFLNKPGDFGTFENGQVADLVLLDAGLLATTSGTRERLPRKS